MPALAAVDLAARGRPDRARPGRRRPGSAASAYGLSAFPFFTAVDAKGKVVARDSGERTPAQLDQLAARLAAAGT